MSGAEELKKKKTKSSTSNITISIGQKKYVDGDIKTVWGKKLPIYVPRIATYA